MASEPGLRPTSKRPASAGKYVQQRHCNASTVVELWWRERERKRGRGVTCMQMNAVEAALGRRLKPCRDSTRRTPDISRTVTSPLSDSQDSGVRQLSGRSARPWYMSRRYSPAQHAPASGRHNTRGAAAAAAGWRLDAPRQHRIHFASRFPRHRPPYLTAHLHSCRGAAHRCHTAALQLALASASWLP